MPWWKFSNGGPEADASIVPDTTGERLTDPMRALLSRLARTEVTASMMSLSNPASTTVQFVRAQGSLVTLQVQDPKLDAMRVFGPLSCVLLVHVTGKHADIVVGSVIREPTMYNGRWLMLVEAGEQLLRADARRTYRVPISETVSLEAVVRGADNRRYRLNAEDISQGGIGGEVINAPPDALPLGQPAQVALRCGPHLVRLDAEVRFRRGSMIGLFFRGVWHRGQLEAPLELRAIVQAVELAWVRRQAGTEAA